MILPDFMPVLRYFTKEYSIFEMIVINTKSHMPLSVFMVKEVSCVTISTVLTVSYWWLWEGAL